MPPGRSPVDVGLTAVIEQREQRIQARGIRIAPGVIIDPGVQREQNPSVVVQVHEDVDAELLQGFVGDYDFVFQREAADFVGAVVRRGETGDERVVEWMMIMASNVTTAIGRGDVGCEAAE